MTANPFSFFFNSQRYVDLSGRYQQDKTSIFPVPFDVCAHPVCGYFYANGVDDEQWELGDDSFDLSADRCDWPGRDALERQDFTSSASLKKGARCQRAAGFDRLKNASG